MAEKGLIVKIKSPRPYCPQCGDIKAMESDFSEVSPSGKVNLDDVRIQEGDVLLFRYQNLIAPVYTTRPETIAHLSPFFRALKNFSKSLCE